MANVFSGRSVIGESLIAFSLVLTVAGAAHAAQNAAEKPVAGKTVQQGWQKNMDEANKAIKAGNLALAEKRLRMALVETSSLKSTDSRIGLTLWELAQVHKSRGEVIEAELHARNALKNLEPYKDRLPHEYAGALNTLAWVLKDRGEYKEAEETYESVIALLTRLDDDDQALATTLDNLGDLYLLQNRYARAVEVQKKVLSIYEGSKETNPKDLAIALNNLAESYTHNREYDKARKTFERAIAIAEKQYGPLNPIIATFKDNLSAVYKDEGKLDEAERLELEAVNIYRKSLGAMHPDMAIALHNLADLYMMKNDRARAREYYKEALAIISKTYGARHPMTREFVASLAEVDEPAHQ